MFKYVGNSLYSKCSPDWSWTVDSLPDFDLWFIDSGRGTMDLNGKRIILKSGGAILLNPGSSITARQDPDHNLKVFAAHFQPESDEILQTMGNKMIDTGNRNFFKELFIRHVRSESLKENREAIWLEALISELQLRSETHERKTSSYYHHKIEEISRQIGDQPELAWTMNMLAGRAALCKDHFIRLFREQKGQTPGQFIIEARLIKAGQLLTESDLPVYRIAELCGFDSSQWFCRLFRRKKGISPGTYRKYSHMGL